MCTAIFHNFMDNIGGAEMVSLTLARELNGDIYTTNIGADKITKMGFADVLPRIYSIGTIPKQVPFRHQMAFWKFRRLNLIRDAKKTGRHYDQYIISGDWAMSAAVNHKPNLWYVHSPLNELWQFKDMIRQEMMNWWKRPIFDIWVWINRRLTLSYAQHVERWVCNSHNTQGRIKKFYGKDAEIIYPPIYTNQYQSLESKGYWLSVNRLFVNKRVEMQLEAFKQLPEERLIIVGSYEKGAQQFEMYQAKIEKSLPTNVKIIHWATAETLRQLYGECKGFITTARDEDFGMTAVEAMASGKLVIAPNEGGYKESVLDQATGILIDDIDSKKLAHTIYKANGQLISNPEHYRKNCLKRSATFDTSIFISKMK